MTRQYTVTEIRGSKIISYYENGFSYSFGEDELNSDYQAYLRWLENPDADEFKQGEINE
jgi:hypothetical protein